MLLQKMQQKRKKKGFTLVELLVVIAIIAVLLLIAVPKFMESTKGAKIRTFEANYRTLMSSTVTYSANRGGSYTDIEKTTSDVVKQAADLEDKPNGATYVVGKEDITATLKGTEFGPAGTKDYVLKFTYATGKTTPTDAPGEASFK